MDSSRSAMVDGNVLLKAMAGAHQTGFEVVKTRDRLEPKVCSRAEAQPISVVSALLLGHWSGTWGDAMFYTRREHMLNKAIHLKSAVWTTSRGR